MAELDLASNPRPLLCIPAPGKPVSVVCRPHPFRSDKVIKHFPCGHRISDMMKEVDLDPDRVHARVFLDDVLIEQAYWHLVKPKAGHLVTIRVIPQGGGGQGKDVLRVVAMVGVLALAIAIPFLAPAAFGLTTAAVGGFTVLSTAGGLVAGGLAIAGSLRILSLIPPPHSLRQIGDHR